MMRARHGRARLPPSRYRKPASHMREALHNVEEALTFERDPTTQARILE
jgi:hypothetical protein